MNIRLKYPHCCISIDFSSNHFRLPDLIGNIATWTETQWELNKVIKIDMELPCLCNATKSGPIAFPKKLSFPALKHLCKRFGSKVFLIENKKTLQQALEVTDHIDCDAEYPSSLGTFQSEKFPAQFLSEYNHQVNSICYISTADSITALLITLPY